MKKIQFAAVNLVMFVIPCLSFAAGSTKAIVDAWYTMQAGNTPWGFYHEVIEERDQQFTYRYNMTRIEGGVEYQENIGALAEADLTPIAFNINKSGSSTTESINASFKKEKNGGYFNIDVQGTKKAQFKRYISKGTIQDVFFPLWLKSRWSQLKPGFKGLVSTFVENPTANDFGTKYIQFTVKGNQSTKSCLEIEVRIENMPGTWCMNEKGILETMQIQGHTIQHVKSEAEAKAFVKGLMKTK